ncbi:MAG: hypothetical protein DME26_00870 [Verrucomicrobia bacterium]|nr:MAG: hypothetical protein DME26_00870 [Verrucomicrobiota bacterium]
MVSLRDGSGLQKPHAERETYENGAITTNDFPRPGRGIFAKLLDTYDANDDGAISSAELMAAAELMAEDLQADFLAKYDTNKDGQVTSDEALAVHQAIVSEEISALLQKYDLNGDGAVTSDEVNTVLQSRNGNRHGGLRPID